MNWQKEMKIRAPRTATVPPPGGVVGETGWDILLALHSDAASKLSLDKLASIASVNHMAMGKWLSWLEDRRLITGARDERTSEVRPVLTSGGRDLLDRYLSATADFQNKIRH